MSWRHHRQWQLYNSHSGYGTTIAIAWTHTTLHRFPGHEWLGNHQGGMANLSLKDPLRAASLRNIRSTPTCLHPRSKEALCACKKRLAGFVKNNVAHSNAGLAFLAPTRLRSMVC